MNNGVDGNQTFYPLFSVSVYRNPVMKITIETDSELESVTINFNYKGTGNTQVQPTYRQPSPEITTISSPKVVDSRESLDDEIAPKAAIIPRAAGVVLDVPEVEPILDDAAPGMKMDEL